MTPAQSRDHPWLAGRPVVRMGAALGAIVGGGVMLGSLLALHANPVPRPRPPAAWERMFQPRDIPLDSARLWFEAPPTDLHPGWQDSYRLDLDYDTVVIGWTPPPLPRWDDAYGDSAVMADPGLPSPMEGDESPAIQLPAGDAPAIQLAGDAAARTAAEAAAVATATAAADPAR